MARLFGLLGVRNALFGMARLAHLAWRVLKEADGVGWVTAGKVLVRKRPRLGPATN